MATAQTSPRARGAGRTALDLRGRSACNVRRGDGGMSHHRSRAQRRLGCGVLLTGALLALPSLGHAGPGDEATLVLGVSQNGKLDARLSRVLSERLQHNGENVLPNAQLSSADRQCLSAECFDQVAVREGARLLITTTLQENGPNNFFITSVLYDSVKHVPYQTTSTCDCLSEALAVRVSDMADKLLKEYRQREANPSVITPPPGPGETDPNPRTGPGPSPKQTQPAIELFTPTSKVVAGILGGLGIAALATSIVWTAYHNQPSDGPCGPAGTPMVCFHNNTSRMIGGYVATGLLAAGVGVTLYLGHRSASKNSNKPSSVESR